MLGTPLSLPAVQERMLFVCDKHTEPKLDASEPTTGTKLMLTSPQHGCYMLQCYSCTDTAMCAAFPHLHEWKKALGSGLCGLKVQFVLGHIHVRQHCRVFVEKHEAHVNVFLAEQYTRLIYTRLQHDIPLLCPLKLLTRQKIAPAPKP